MSRSAIRMQGLALVVASGVLSSARQDEALLAPAVATILEAEVELHARYLASEELEGRDSPSRGLELAARYLCERFARAGLLPSPDAATAWSRVVSSEPAPAWSIPEGSALSYLRPLQVERVENRAYRRPVAEDCALELLVDGASESMRYGLDFVPVAGMDGDVRGELIFAGFGISSKTEKYDDLDGLRLKGKVALIVQGEPEHPKRFEGPEVTEEASLWRKVAHLSEAGALAVVVVRRPALADPKARVAADPGLGFRYTWAFFNGQRPDAPARETLPMVEVSLECASKLLGEDVANLVQKIDRSARPVKVKGSGRILSLRTRTEEGPVRMDNVVAIQRGQDAELKEEWVILGAHYDHIGVGVRGLVGYGADDNASGTAAMIEIAEAFAKTTARRSLLFVAFSGEEDGMVGSKALANDLPFPAESVVAMLNLDMIGRGEADVAMVLGLQYNPDLERVLQRAKKVGKTGIKKIEPNSDRGLFERSDQISFHKVGIPTLFFMEDLALATNTQYHTWQDRVDLLDFEKIANTAKLAFYTAWLLANDEKRPSPPRE